MLKQQRLNKKTLPCDYLLWRGSWWNWCNRVIPVSAFHKTRQLFKKWLSSIGGYFQTPVYYFYTICRNLQPIFLQELSRFPLELVSKTSDSFNQTNRLLFVCLFGCYISPLSRRFHPRHGDKFLRGKLSHTPLAEEVKNILGLFPKIFLGLTWFCKNLPM